MAKQRRQPASHLVWSATYILVIMIAGMIGLAEGQFTDTEETSGVPTTPANLSSSTSIATTSATPQQQPESQPQTSGPSFSSTSPATAGLNCPEDSVTFELITGYVYSAPADMLDSQPGTLMLTDCIQTCRQNASCQSINYETGLCVLFSSNADSMPGALTTSQFPVFTLYVQKNCLRITVGPTEPVESITDGRGALRISPPSQRNSPLRPQRLPTSRAEPVGANTVCNRAWSFERVQGYELEALAKRRRRVANRQACEELCLGEREFTCRSVNFNNVTGDCRLSDMDRHTMAGTGAFKPSSSSDYMENNCVDDPVKLCEFQKLEGRILKTVDSVFQDVSTIDDCRQLCLTAPYRCHSFDYADTGENVCRLSHHALATLTNIQEPYLEITGAATYELSSCYNVTIDCRSGDMVAKIRTSKIFNGKIYAKGSPNSCVNDVTASLDFELRMAYNDIECNVRKDGQGRYSNDIILQHHDRIITSADLGLSVHCQYDLGNKSVSNQVDLEITGDIIPVLSEEAVVEGPNVVMRVTSKDGVDVPSAQVGDALDLRFEIVDKNSPYEIFVRDLVALDGVDSNEILLIDDRGCPTDPSIMGVIDKSVESSKILLSAFDAFKFPSSDKVQFRALVSPCLPSCEPVKCDVADYTGDVRLLDSYGRKRRALARQRRDASNEEVLVVQTIEIVDRFNPPPAADLSDRVMELEKERNHYSFINDLKHGGNTSLTEVFIKEKLSGSSCINTLGLIIAGALFLAAQLVIIVAWTYIWQRKRRAKQQDNMTMVDVAVNNLHQLYNPSNAGYSRRL